MRIRDHSNEYRSSRRKAVCVKRTPLGLGVFSGRRYRAEQIVGEVTGVVIDDWNYSSSYCMDLGDSRSLEPAPPFRFVNHSCQPNCSINWFDVQGSSTAPLERRIFLIALVAIAWDEELTIDYAWPAWAAVRCRCRSANCRGWVVAQDQVSRITTAEFAAV